MSWVNLTPLVFVVRKVKYYVCIFCVWLSHCSSRSSFVVYLVLVVVVPFADRFIVLAYHAGFGVLFVLFL